MQVVKNMLTSNANKGPYMKSFLILLFPFVLFGCGSESSPDAANVSSKSKQAVVSPVKTAEPVEPPITLQDQTQNGVPTVNSIGSHFVTIPAGTFTMGDANGDDDETPHQVTLTKGFELGVYEVTQEQYEQVMGSNPSEFKGPQHPVEKVSWDDAVEFCRKLSALPAEKSAGYVYRLPTEAEWEYACRAGTTTKYSFGDSESELGDYAWYNENSGRTTHSVGQKKPNGFGLYDMHGNVWEWCQDWYGDYPKGSTTDPTGAASGSARVHRGGCCYYDSVYCRSADRNWRAPGPRYADCGFRVLRSSVNAPSPSENQNASLYPPKDLLDTAVASESLTVKQEPPSANLDDNQTLYTSDGKRFSGWVKKYWESNKSQVQMLAEYKNGLISGKGWTWHENGQLESIEHYKNDVPHGSFTMWYANGQKAHEKTHKDGNVDGFTTFWHENGQKRTEATFKNGELDGKETNWHDNGQLLSEATYKGGKPVDGVFTKWHDTGEKKIDSLYKNGKKEGKETIWHKNGQLHQEGTYKDGKFDGLVNVWYDDGQKLQETTFKDGKPVDGVVTTWHQNGKKKSEGNVKNGKLNGKTTTWHENGQKVLETSYMDGELDGLGTTWQENGQTLSVGTFKGGKPVGLHVQWHVNGKKKLEATFKNGKLIGAAKKWTKDGKLVSE